MAKEENSTAQENARIVEKASAVPEKFKDVDALVRAYAALQSEFTRRSQRLKELEKTVENFQTEARGDNSGVEKLRKNAAARKRAAKAFDDFVAVVEGSETSNEQDIGKPMPKTAEPTGQALETQTAQAATTGSMEDTAETEKGRLQKNGREGGEEGNAPRASVETEEIGGTRQPVAGSGNAALLSSEELYRNAVGDERVRLRIIGEYLASVGRSGPPLTTGSVGMLTTPARRAKSIGAAGAMALQYLKNE